MNSINTKQQNAENNMIDYTTHNMEKKVQALKERNSGKQSTDAGATEDKIPV